ncbi:hypothetical protein HZS_1404 [Henneguya salminicola]|nr:hypothetical protein HZS_1404 [Henneguya salminicola]
MIILHVLTVEFRIPFYFNLIIYRIHNEAEKCNCRENWAGEDCSFKPCDNNVCNNNGTCVIDGSEEKCICNEYYGGEHCELFLYPQSLCRQGY